MKGKRLSADGLSLFYTRNKDREFQGRRIGQQELANAIRAEQAPAAGPRLHLPGAPGIYARGMISCFVARRP